MQTFKDKVAVITGAASGIGFGIAERCAQEGMKVVLTGINHDNLLRAQEKLASTGATLLSVQADVSKREDIEALAQKTLNAFGATHLLVNNAGVGAGGTAWGSTWEDWKWTINVNLWGVIHGVKIFVPIMLAQDTECHIVNVSSIAGVLPYHPKAAYQVTKHAVVALTEHLHYSLAERKTQIGVSVYCPGWVQTRILESGRNRPPELQNEPTEPSPALIALLENMRKEIEAGKTPQQAADDVFNGIRAKQLYILTPEFKADVQARMDDILGSFGE